MERSTAIRVLVVDDSALMRKMLGDSLGAMGGLEVCGTAPNGKLALSKIDDLDPDVVTLDVDMPGMSGIEVLERIMSSEKPRPVVMFSSKTKRGAEVTLAALEAGAADYALKPDASTGIVDGFARSAEELGRKIISVARYKPVRRTAGGVQKSVASPSPTAVLGGDFDPSILIAIGVSTGGPPALTLLLAALPEKLSPSAIVQHMPAPFVLSFAERLNKLSKLEVVVAADGMTLGAGRCVIAPGERQMEIRSGPGGYRVKVYEGSKVGGHMPSANVLMNSAASCAGKKAVGVIMTGMGRDGAEGMAAIRRAGGTTIAQDEATCVVYGMPKAVVDEGNAMQIEPLPRIASAIVKACVKQ